MKFSWIIFIIEQIGRLLCCERGWTAEPERGYCYKLFTKPIKSWSESKQCCQDSESSLASIVDYKEQAFINHTFLFGEVGVHTGVWLGASQVKSLSCFRDRDCWKWADKSDMEIDLYAWKNGNPDNGKSLLSGSEDCLIIDLEKGSVGQFNDFTCDRKLPFLCKVKDTADGKEEYGSPAADANILTPVLAILLSLTVLVIVVIAIVFFRRRHSSSGNDYTACARNSEHTYDEIQRGSSRTNGGYGSPYTKNNRNEYGIPRTTNVSTSSYCYATTSASITQENMDARLNSDHNTVWYTRDAAHVTSVPSREINTKRVIVSNSGYIELGNGTKTNDSGESEPQVLTEVVEDMTTDKKYDLPIGANKEDVTTADKKCDLPIVANNEDVPTAAKVLRKVKFYPKPVPRPKNTL